MYKLLGRLCVCCGNLGDGGHFGKSLTGTGSHICKHVHTGLGHICVRAFGHIHVCVGMCVLCNSLALEFNL